MGAILLVCFMLDLQEIYYSSDYLYIFVNRVCSKIISVVISVFSFLFYELVDNSFLCICCLR